MVLKKKYDVITTCESFFLINIFFPGASVAPGPYDFVLRRLGPLWHSVHSWELYANHNSYDSLRRSVDFISGIC
jgi:hypothetical protein